MTSEIAGAEIIARLPFIFLSGLLFLCVFLAGVASVEAYSIVNVLALLAATNLVILILVLLSRRLLLRLSSYLCCAFAAFSIFLSLLDSIDYPWKLFAAWLVLAGFAFVSTVGNLYRERSMQFFVELLVEIAMSLPFARPLLFVHAA